MTQVQHLALVKSHEGPLAELAQLPLDVIPILQEH